MLLAHMYGRAATPAIATSIVFCAIACALMAGCTQDHSALAVDPPTTSAASSSAGAGGAMGAGGAAATGTGGMDGEGGSIVEPVGPTELTIVNGVNDYEAIRICFLPYPEGSGESTLPWPSSPQGIAFATSAVLSPIKSVIPIGTDVHVHVIGGNLALTAGKTCAQVFAMAEGGGGGGSAPPVVLAPLAVLPASVFVSEKSLLLVTTGCLGGPGHADPSAPLACGASYTPDTPTAGLVALGMSRIKTPGKMALQVVHASASMPSVDVRIKAGGQTPTEWLVAPKLSTGAIGPKPPFDTLKVSGYGVLESAQVITAAPGDTYSTSATLLSSIFAKGSIKASDFKDGEGLVLVAVGGYPGMPAGPWWHALTFSLVRGDP